MAKTRAAAKRVDKPAKSTAAATASGDQAMLNNALGQIEKTFGKGSIMKLTDTSSAVSGISTGALSLDIALGGYGLPRGRIIELFGPESSGKTTLALHVIAEAQKAGRHRRHRRRRACPRPVVGQTHRSEPRRAAGQPAVLR